MIEHDLAFLEYKITQKIDDFKFYHNLKNEVNKRKGKCFKNEETKMNQVKKN